MQGRAIKRAVCLNVYFICKLYMIYGYNISDICTYIHNKLGKRGEGSMVTQTM